MKALLKSYGDVVVGNAMDLVELKSELREEKCKHVLTISRAFALLTPFWMQEIKFLSTHTRVLTYFHKFTPSTYLIEFAFESVVVDIIGDVLQLAMLVEIDNGVVSESIDDFAVV